jgi:transposase
LEHRLKATKNWLEARKIQAILLLNQNINLKTISYLTQLKRSRIFTLRQLFLKVGLRAVATKPRKVESLLTKRQLKEIKITLKTKKPRELNYEEDFWTTSILADYIDKTYSVKYKSKTSYYLIFKRVKFTFHKPQRIYEKRNEREVLSWRIKTEKIVRESWLQPKTIILCGDEMLLSTQTTIQKLWLPQSEYPQITVSNTRKNISIYGFLNLKTGQEHAFTAEKQTMCETEKQLKKLRRIYPKQKYKLLILWDNPGWHRGSLVQDFIKKDKNIEIIYFPPYSPEENPQEHVWKEGRSKITHNQFIPNLKQTALKFITYLNQTKFNYSLLNFKSSVRM